ncbi:hypothetical protein Tco_0958394 [Tanacetum coccineum]
MIWRGTSLRYEMGEKKVNEVDFISQGVELVSRILAKMEIKIRLLEEVKRLEWWFEQDIDDEGEEDEKGEGGGKV